MIRDTNSRWYKTHVAIYGHVRAIIVRMNHIRNVDTVVRLPHFSLDFFPNFASQEMGTNYVINTLV